MKTHDTKYLTLAEVADRLRLSQQTVRVKIRNGELPGIKLGYNCLRVEEEQLDLYIESKRTAPTQ